MLKFRLIIIIFILILFSVMFGVYNSFGLSLEYDKNFSTYSLVTNSQALTDIGQFVNDKLFYSVRFKIFTSAPISYIPIVIGHELNHGSICRKAGLDHHYKWSERICSHHNTGNPTIDSYVNIGGYLFENELNDRVRKDQIMNGATYKSAMSVFFNKASFYVSTLDNRESNDFNGFTKKMKMINPKTKLDRNYVNDLVVNTVFYDPSFIFNTMFLAHSFWMNQEWHYKFPYIHSNFDFNLYPEAITKEVGFAKNIGQNHFLKVNYEWGQNVWNKKVKGFSVEFTNIPLYRDIISLDYKYHLVEKTLCYSLSTFHIGNSYVRWKHNKIKMCEIDDDDEFYFGFNFNFRRLIDG